MRIDLLELIACGPFTDRLIDLSAGAEGLHLIWGPNEAGKSSALRALRDGLFGFPSQTKDNFKHANQKLRVGMRLRRRDGGTLAFIRRKGNKGTLLDPETQKPLAENALGPWLGPVDRELFTKMHGLDYQELQAGGQEMLKTGSEIGQLLFSAAGRAGNVRKVVDLLREQASALFKPSASLPRINASIREWRELQDQIKSVMTPSERVDQLRREIESLEIALRESGQLTTVPPRT